MSEYDQKQQLSLIAQGCLTNSKHADRFVKDVYPTHALGGHECFLECSDGHIYNDFICGLGTNLIGYANVKVTRVIRLETTGGICHSLPNPREYEAAEILRQIFPFTEKFKFLKTGSEACTAAVRIARAATGRKFVLSEGYHGWHDGFIGLGRPGHGSQVHREFAHFEGPGDIREDTAAVIIEPVSLDDSEKRIETLRKIRKKCDETGTILIFDETITGFRYRKHGVCNHHQITPDLLILGKAIAAGMPLACVAGKSSIMDTGYFVSSTYAGEVLSLVACIESCKILLSDYNYRIEDLWIEARNFMEEFNKISEIIQIKGYATRGYFVASPIHLALFWQEACKAKILFGPSIFINFKHPKYFDTVLNTCKSIIMRIKSGSVRLEGKMPIPVF